MTFESYAKGREFQTITLPTPTMQFGAINRILESKNFTQGQADASFKLQQKFAKIHLDHGIESARVASDNLRTNQWLIDKNQTLMQKQELHNYKVAIDNAKRANPQSKEALVDKFGSLFELVPKFAGQIAAIKQKENEADYKKGINLINRVRATSSQIAELQATKGELWDENKNYVQAAQVLKNQGATDDDLYTITNSSGWVHFGMIEAGLNNIALHFDQYFLNNIDTPYPVGEENLSYSQAKSSGNIGAVQNILSQMQAEFGAASFRQLGIETPNEALATGFFEKLDKISDARYNDALRTSLSLTATVNNDTRRMQVFNALNEDGIKTYFSQFINGYEDPNNKNWRRNAIATSFDDVVAYYKQDNVNISNIQEALEATRPDGTPLLGNINKAKLEGVIAEKQEKALEISQQGLKRRKQAIEQAKMQILADIQGQKLNPQGMFELQRMYKDVPEIHQWISTLITPQVTDEENRQNSAELEYKASQGLLTTEMVLQSSINQATKFKFLGDKRLDNPYPDQKKEYGTLISGELKSILKINSWQDVSNHEHSLRAASAHIHEKTMDRFTSLMRNGNMDATTAFNEALAYGRAEIASLKIIPYKLGDPNSGYIEGYRVDPNGAPLSRISAITRRQQFAKDPNFINVTPLDTKQDYEYLQQKLASGSVLTPDILNDKFPWVRDIVDLYGGHLTAQEVLEANAKTVGVNLAFPTTIEPSNLSPDLARQNRLLAK